MTDNNFEHYYNAVVRLNDGRIYYNYGNGFVGSCENPHPEYKLWKIMPCGHQGLWVIDRWVCQICWGYEIPCLSQV